MYLNGVGVKQDEAEARRLLKLAAEQGLPEAQFELGKLLAFQSYTKEDVEAGIGWLQKAADQGVGPAAEALNAAQEAKEAKEETKEKETGCTISTQSWHNMRGK